MMDVDRGWLLLGCDFVFLLDKINVWTSIYMVNGMKILFTYNTSTSYPINVMNPPKSIPVMLHGC